MNFKKFLVTLFQNRTRDQCNFKNARKVYMALACWVLGEYCIEVFPRIAHKYRGSLEMLIPVTIVVIVLTIPLTFMALGMSQYSKRGCIKLFDASPAWRGIGIAGIMCLYISSLNSFVYCTYFFYYATRSLEDETPWLKCGNQNFRKEGCFTYRKNRSIHLDCIDAFDKDHCSSIPWKNSAQYFWEGSTSNSAKDTERWKSYRVSLIPHQIAVVLMVHICIRNSAQSIEIFGPFLLIFPTILQGSILVMSLLHPGTFRALENMSRFKFSSLMSAEFWVEITIFSLSSVGYVYGGLSMLGMQHHFRNVTNMEAVFINVASVTYSILYTALTYNTFGILSYQLNIPMEVIFEMSSSANFIQCPLGISHFKLAKFWAFLFFFSNFLIMFRHLVMQSEVILSVFYEAYPNLKLYTIPCSMVLCTISFLINIISDLDFVHSLIHETSTAISAIIFPLLAFYSNVFINFFYGTQHFVEDMHFMLGFRPATLWRMSWFIGFIVYFVLFIYGCFIFRGTIYDLTPVLSYCIIGIICSLGLIPIVYFFTIFIVTWQKNISVVEAFTPLKNWGPREEILRKSRDMFSAHDMTKEYLYRQQRLRVKPT